MLPDSYKAFLRTSNGWARTTPFVGRIRVTQDVEWFRTENEQWIEVYSASGSRIKDAKYYVYTEEGAAEFRAKHLASVLQISDVDDGVYLLNPEAVTPDGEWEAWFFANWLPGAKRFPSFAHLILHEYQMFAGLYELEPTDFGLQALTSFPADVPRVAAERTPTKSRTAPSRETLIEQMRSTDAKLRSKAVRVFLGQLKGRRKATRSADLVGQLADLFRDSQDAAVRAACISALTELAEDDQPPAAFLEALSDADPGVVLTGISALTYFPDSRAVEPLCRFIDSRVNALFNESAMSQLGEMGNERAVPTLLNVLLDVDNEFDQSFGTAAIALAQCGSAGFDALVKAHAHEDPRIRLAAVVGLDVSGNPKAKSLLEQSANDSDSRVRDRARIRTRSFLFRNKRS